MITVDGGVSISKVTDRLYRVNDPIVVFDGHYIVVRSGFVSDGATIPRFLWFWVGSPWTGNYTRAVLVHDWLYNTHQYDTGEPVTRARADAILYEIARLDKTNRITAALLWIGVRIGGWLLWNRKNKLYLHSICGAI